MSYKAIYRKWRPNIFEDVIGQDKIVTILKNQIKFSNIAHAYLFTGTRGTGKTSLAKIFARAVNCIDPKDSNPCNVCEVCQGILMENIMDVIEIDAASNNGVDNVREIRENVKYPPSKGKYKIYIIDEVHMLSTGAFNALLKTLEEPPSYVIFILATTEPHKIPATILSRCQRFDFKPILIKDIIDRLAFICDDMGIIWEKEALRSIALNSGGALRDALSILEQCISFSQDSLTYENVTDILGMVNHEILFNLVDGVGEKDSGKVLQLINEIIMDGKDISQLTKDIISHFRNIILVKMNVQVDEILSLADEIKDKLKNQGQQFTLEELSLFIYSLSDIESKLRNTAQPRVLLEIGVVGLCNKQLNDSLEGIIERVKELEEIIERGNIKVNTGYNIESNMDRKTRKVEKPPEIREKNQQARPLDKDIKSEKTSKDWETRKDTKSENEKHEPRGDIENLDITIIQKSWNKVLDELRKNKKAQIQALLKEGSPVDIKGNALVISFKDGSGFHREALDKEKTKEFISGIIEKITSQKVDLSFVMEDELTIGQEVEEEDPLEKLQKALPKDINEILEVINE